MLKPMYDSNLSEQDRQIFDALVPADHSLRQVRREQRATARKLAEVVRQHDGRRARYRGRGRNRIQYLLTELVVNIKRKVGMLLGPPRAGGSCAAAYPIAA